MSVLPKDFATHYKSPLGMMTMTSDGSHITGLWFDGQEHLPISTELIYIDLSTLRVFKQAKNWLDTYFSGDIPDFLPPILLRTTSFRRSVLEYLLTIPYGHTTTYGNIAERYGHRSARAVGGAVSKNPIMLMIPCHRVVGTRGRLTGYAGGLDRKIRLLKKEKVLVL